jgi:acetyl-CoA carboxylase carboxyltransferase component
MTAAEDNPGLREDALAGARRSRLDEGRPEAVAKQHQRQLMTARQRIAALIDPGSFLEYGLFAEPVAPGIVAPSDGVVTGLGTVEGNPVAIISYDYTVLGGSQGHVGHHKLDRLLELAGSGRWAVVVFAEGGGARAQETGGGYNVGGRITTFRGMAELSGRVPTVAVVPGPCFAGTANVAAFCDCIIATRAATLGVAGPPLVKAATGQLLAPEEIGPAEMHAEVGDVEVLCDDDSEATDLARAYLSYFLSPDVAARPSPATPEEIRSLLPESSRRAYDMRLVVRSLFDEDSILELRAAFAGSVITALCRLEGMAVGVIASQPSVRAGSLDSPSADKMARFIQLCGAFGIPLIFLVDTPGNVVGPAAEASGLLRHSVRPALALVHAGVPFITVVLRKSYGLAQFCMGSRMIGPLLHLVWPTAEFGEMGMQGAANILDGATGDTEAHERRVKSMGESYLPTAYAAQFRTDDIVDPADTRDIMARALRLVHPSPVGARDAGRRWVDTW